MKIQVFWDVTACRLDSRERNLEPEDRGTRLLQSVIIGLSQGKGYKHTHTHTHTNRNSSVTASSLTLRKNFGDRIMDTWTYMDKSVIVKQISQGVLLLIHDRKQTLTTKMQTRIRLCEI
jgi:hypothetical protein